MTRKLHMVCALALLTLQVLIPLIAADDSVVAAGAVSPNGTADSVFAYRMRGEIRFLLIWFGRDDVGGGRITIKRDGEAPRSHWTEEIEVLFGSNPDRIPGKINRWGYGRESSEWLQTSDNTAPVLVGTKFEGFMRRSEEKSIEQAKKESKIAATSHVFRFAATESRVFPEEASSEIRTFSTSEEFHYRNPERLLSHYQARLARTPADKKEYLLNRPPVYDLPCGFLTALNELIRKVVGTHEKQPDAWVVSRPWLTFVYNAKPYRLEVLRIKEEEEFRLPMQPATMRMPRVARVQFRSLNTVKGTRTDFDLWLPMSGQLKGIPLRIQIQPRWWLRLRLDLDLQNSRPTQDLTSDALGSRDALKRDSPGRDFRTVRAGSSSTEPWVCSASP